MKITCIAIDDEPLALQGLAYALIPYPDFELLGRYRSAEEAMTQSLQNIDVIFVDIEMPQKSGFDLLHDWPGPLPMVVFVTAYQQYAIKAFEHNALDYVLKPIDENRFAQVIRKIRDNLAKDKHKQDKALLLATIAKLQSQVAQQSAEISVKTDEGYYRVLLEDIMWVEAIGDHICLHLTDKQLIVRQRLKVFFIEVAEQGFYQIHRSILVNQLHVSVIKPVRFGDYEVILHNDKSLRMSRRYKALYLQLSKNKSS